MNRRDVIIGASLAAAGWAVPGRVFAQAAAANPRERQILEIAQREVARAGDVLWRRDSAAVADFGVHSSVPRFHFVNLEGGTVNSLRVTHGQGSDPDHDGFLKTFSNVHGSLASCRGAFITWDWYIGQFGLSMRMTGLDPDNSNAYDRAIVMHPAEYASQQHLDRWGRLGRSNGCFAVAPDDFRTALDQLMGGRLLFADKLAIG